MIYLVPGLGADHRVFKTIHLIGFETSIIRWAHPHHGESIEDYTKRLLPQVNQAPTVFIGLSFGGLIAAELTKHFPDSKLVLISSIASRNEIPWWEKTAAFFRLNRMFSGKFMKRPNALIRWIFSVKPGRDRKIFDDILRDSDPGFLYWAVNALLHWKGNAKHRLHHIHGKKDRLLPVKFTSADIIIPDGGHLMILSHGEKLSRILEDILTRAGIDTD